MPDKLPGYPRRSDGSIDFNAVERARWGGPSPFAGQGEAAIAYPNAEHQREDQAARRRAKAALELLISEANRLHFAISQGGRVDGDDAQQLADGTRKATANFGVIGALADVREWHAADQAERAAPAGRFRCEGCGKTITTPAEVDAHKLVHGLVVNLEPGSS